MGRRVVRLLVVAGAFAVFAPAAQAGLLPGSCDLTPSRPFAQFGDYAKYVLVPGGDFEGTLYGWTLGGARVVEGNETFFVGGASDHRSLFVPAGTSVTTAPLCMELLQPNIRFFVAGSGSVRVQLVIRNLLGALTILDGGTVRAEGEWAPTPQVLMLYSSIAGPLNGSVRFRLTAAGGPVQVDDLYVDPYLNL